MDRGDEIQIGDWLRSRYKDKDGSWVVKDFRVDSLIRRSDEIEVWSDLGHMGYANMLEWIRLTPEILEKNGFTLIDGPFLRMWVLFGLTLRRWDDRFHLKCEKDIDMEIIYVHQLQHLLKMVGIHRDIVL